MQNSVDREIDEASASISAQHMQCQWYVKTYLFSVTGLFLIASYFGKEASISLQASAVGVTYSIIVFFVGWGFLSIIAHKASMIHMLYKHIANMREIRVNRHKDLLADYVLSRNGKEVRFGSLLTDLPYLFFAFNFILLCGGLAYFISPHTEYYQSASIVIMLATFFGTFYPIVCVSFKKRIHCAFKARNIEHKHILEESWSKTVKERKREFRTLKILTLLVANIGAIGICMYSFSEASKVYSQYIPYFCYIGVLLYGLLRFSMEKYRLKIGFQAINRKVS